MAQVREAQRVANGIEIVEEMAHTGDPQSNGAAEQTVWIVKSKTMSVLATLERNLGKKIPLSHPIAGWAAQYAADCVNRYVMGSDGTTCIQRLRGGGARQPVACFGETVLFPMLSRERKSWGNEVEHCGRWARGVWVGRSWNSNESIVLHAHGVSRPRTVKRLVNEKKWRSDLVEKVTTLPWGEDVAKEEEGDHAEKNPVPKGESVPLEAQ